MLRASIVVIGDEILSGHVRDTNSNVVARMLARHAVPLDRVHVVPDTHAAIDEALQAELARARPRVVVTTGGIGSTPDDVTFEAVAASLGRPTVLEPTIAERLDGALAWTAEQGVEVDDDFRHMFQRMARVPEGARLLPGAGWAPALQVDVDGGVDTDGGATIVVLPGVPSQCETITRTGLEPLVDGRNEPWHTVEVEHGFPESVLNPAFAALGRDHPRVDLGSYPGDPMLVRLKGPRDEVEAAAEDVRAAIAAIDASGAGPRLRRAWARRTGDDEDDG